MTTLPNHLLGPVVVPKSKVEAAAQRIALEIDADFNKTGEPPVLVTVQQGAVYFSELVRRYLKTLYLHHFLKAKSYIRTSSSGKVKITPPSKEFMADINGKRVILIEDIIDTGATIKAVHKLLAPHAANVEICTMLIKKLPSNQLWRVFRRWGLPGHPRIKYVGHLIADFLYTAVGWTTKNS